MAEAARRRGARFDIDVVRGQRAPVVTRRGWAALVGDTPAPSFRTVPASPAPNNRALADAARAETYLDRARRAEADGQPQLAKVFYQRVAKHGDAQLKHHAEARLHGIEVATNPQR